MANEPPPPPVLSKTDIDARLAALQEVKEVTRYGAFSALFQVARDYIAVGEKALADKAERQAVAFMLHTGRGSFPGHFQPLAEFAGGATNPPLEFFSDERLAQYAEAARHASSPVHAARYADIAWEFSKRKDPAMARLAIDSYVAAAAVYRRNLWGVEYSEALRRALQLATLFHDEERLGKIKDAFIAELEWLDKEKDYRFAMDLAEALPLSKDLKVSEDEKTRVLRVLDNAVAHYASAQPKREVALGPTKGPDEHLGRSCVETRAALLKDWKRPEADPKAAKKLLAESYEREAKAALEDKNALAAVLFLTNAEKLYGEAGLRAEQERLRVQIPKVGKQAEESFTSFETTVEIKKEEMEQHVSALTANTLEKSLDKLAGNSSWVPSLAETQKRVAKQKEEYAIQFMISKTVLKDGHVVGQATKDEDLQTDAEIRDLCMAIQMSSMFRRRVFEHLMEKQGLTAETLAMRFEKWGVCGPESLTLLRAGFAHYFNKDYVSAVHILTPQFEAILRRLLETAGRPVSNPQEGQFYILGTLLKDPMLAEVAGADRVAWYRLSLADPRGLNIRNDLTHGLLGVERMNKDTVELVIHLILSLTRYVITEKPAEGGPK
jgi:lysyl-tRNA synthetase class 1